MKKYKRGYSRVWIDYKLSERDELRDWIRDNRYMILEYGDHLLYDDKYRMLIDILASNPTEGKD